MRILVAPDKFKGSLTGKQVIEAIRQGINSFDPSIEVVAQPLADGGEGTLEILDQTLGLDRVTLEVSGPLGLPVEGHYLLGQDSAFIEMAQASGLLLLNKSDRNPLFTSTEGTGEMIKDAMDNGAKSIYLFVGGSSTNDCGLGMARALGYIFNDEAGLILAGQGKDLGGVRGIDGSKVDERLSQVRFTVLTDVQNPLLGVNGAAHVYAPQKGASEEEVTFLEKGAVQLTQVVSNGKEHVPGAGAAGGLGYGALTFLNAEIQSGIHFLMEIAGLQEKVRWADFVITGEGSIDEQTLEGKVIAGLNDLCSEWNKPMAIICGRTTLNSFKEAPIYQIMSIASNEEDAMENAFNYTSQLTQQLLSDFRA